MHKLGGLYLDLDYEMLKPFDLIQYALVLPQSRSITSGDDFERIGNCVFASSPEHPFWAEVIRELEANPPIFQKDYDVEKETGPEFLTKIYNRVKNSGIDIYAPTRQYFHPKVPANYKEYQSMVSNNLSYGIHHCDGTWRKRSLLGRAVHYARLIRSIIVRLVRKK
jgi:mannosyltransferase OCH1-like enzyme